MAENDNDDREERRSGFDRRYIEVASKPAAGPWSDPKTWIALCGIILTVCGLLLTIAIWIGSRMLDEMKAVNANIAALTLTSSNSFTAQAGDIRHLIADQSELKTSLRDQNAYNFDMNRAVTEMATTMKLRGLPVPPIPAPPKLGGQ